MKTLKGIDVSEFQGNIDWEKVKTAGIGFALIRSSINQRQDLKLVKNVQGCEANRIPYGFWHYLKAKTTTAAEAEGETFRDAVSKYGPKLPVFCDIEEAFQTSLSAAEQMDLIDAFLAPVKEARSCQLGIYSFKANLEKLKAGAAARMEDYVIWNAQWSSKDGYSGAHDFWQYSQTGKVDGIAAAVDLDVGYKDYAAEDGTEEAERIAALEAENTALEEENEAMKGKIERIREIIEE